MARDRTQSLKDMRVTHKHLVAHAVWRAGVMSRTQVAREVGISKTTTTACVDELLSQEVLVETSEFSSDQATGRPAKGLRISSAPGVIVGVDLGSDKATGRVCEPSGLLLGEVSTKVSHRPDRRPTSDDVLAAGLEAVHRALDAADYAPGQVLQVVAGVPGVVSTDGRSVSLAPQISGWDGTDVSRALAQELGIPEDRIETSRQTELSILAEWLDGAARSASTAVYVELGVGIGSGILIDGKIYQGASGAAGEVGYLPLDFGDESPPDSRIGSWEWASGGQAFARHGRAAAMEEGGKRLLEIAGGDPERISAETVFSAAREGDPVGRALVQRLGSRIAKGVSAVIAVLDPEYLIVGGGISRSGTILIDAIEREFENLPLKLPYVRLAQFGGDGTVVGAVNSAIQTYLERACAE